MKNKADRSLSIWEDRLASFEKEMDIYVEDPLFCCDTGFFEEELASCRMCLGDVQRLFPEEGCESLRSRILHVERKLDVLKARERFPWSAQFL